MPVSSSGGAGSTACSLRVLDPFDALGGLVENVDDFVEQLIVPAFMRDAVAQSGHEIADRPADLWTLPAAAVMAVAFQPLDQLVDLGRVFLEMSPALTGRLVNFLGVLGLCLGDQAHVLEHGQRRIDDAG